MIITSLINYATPLVRYRIGDQVEILCDEAYLNSYRDDVRITRIFGRKADYLIDSRHNRVSSVGIARAVEGIENKVLAFQFIQKDMNQFIVNLVVEDGYSKNDEKILKDRVIRRLGRDGHYQFNYLDALPREENGKVRFIINEIAEAG
jgi:phenylacetate-CoA ligase